MHELLPIVTGFVIGALVTRLGTPRLRSIILAVSCAVFGVLASFISGELFMSWGYLALDIFQVALAAVVATVLLDWWQRRAT
jgi:hypothetical protein